MILKRYFFILLAMINYSSLISQETIIIDIENSYKKAIDLMNANQYEQALDHIFECQRNDFNNIDYANRLAYCYFQLGNYSEAKLVFGDVLKKDSLNITALSNLASIAERELNYREASNYYGQLITIDSTNSYYYRQSAQVAQRLGDIIGAAAFYNKAHILNKNDIATITDLAAIYLELKAIDYAAQMIAKGMDKDSFNIKVLHINARIKNELDDYPAVIRSINRAMAQGDSTYYYTMMLGVAYLKTEQIDLSIEQFSRIIAKERDSEHTHHYLALAYEMQEDFEQATVHFEIAIEKGISKKVPRYHQDLAKLYEKRGKYNKAYKHYLAAYEYKADDELLFHIAHSADRYYKDKKIALRYYKKYLQTKHQKYSQYTDQRVSQLKEIIHQMMKG